MADYKELRLRQVLEINRQINSSLSREEVLDFILDSARAIIPYDDAAIYLFDSDSHTLRYCAGSSYDGAEQVTFSLASAQEIVRQVIATGESALLRTAACSHSASARLESRSQMAAPIATGSHIVGVISLGSDRLEGFTHRHLEWLTVLATQAAICIDKAARLQELLEKRRMDAELRIARDVQLSLLPTRAPKVHGLDIAGLNIPSKGIGGDYYDFIPIVAGQLGVVVADVVGKSIPAALIMTSFRTLLRAEVRSNYAIHTIFAKVNKFLYETLQGNQYVSAFYGVLDLERQRFTYSNAGHHPAILLRPDGKLTYLEAGGLTLGLFANVRHEERFIDLVPGDLLLLYTDGLVEAENKAGEMFDRERLEQFVRANAHRSASELCEAIYGEMRSFTGSDNLEDDTTIVVAKLLPTED